MSITAPAGFRASGVTAGLKASGSPDVALVVNDGPAQVAAGVFTRNRIVAAPVTWSRQVLAGHEVAAVILNSGGANAFTGPRGFGDTHRTAEQVAGLLDVGAGQVAVCSTGVIGYYLDMDKLGPGVDAAAAALGGSDVDGSAAAEAIRTTDTHAKQAVHPGAGYTLGGMAKGAGMLAPALATMLVILTTDADVSPELCESALRSATSCTFERLDSDGCLSTNDTVLLLASGRAAAPDPEEFTESVTALCHELTMQLLADAEGADHEVAITVRGAGSEADAVTVGREIARSNLLKCAIFGRDPNWGRVIAAAGATDVAFDPNLIDVTINGVQVCRGATPGEDPSTVDLEPRWVEIVVDLHGGSGAATIWTNDLTQAYVHENSAYTT